MYGDNFSLLQFPSLLKRSVLSVGLDLAIMLSSDQQKLQKKQSIKLLFFCYSTTTVSEHVISHFGVIIL